MDKETIVQLLSDGVISNEVAAKYFPELKENEDEKVKKELINAINLAYDCGIAITKENRDKYLAWIERQGEQKPVVIIPKFRVDDVIHLKNSCAEYTIKSISDGHYYGDGFSFNIVGCDRDYELVKQKPNDKCEGCNNVKGCVVCVDGSEWAHIEEQNPAWSEEDIFKVQRICKYLNEVKKYYVDITEVRECMDWLKSLEDRIQTRNAWKPSKEQIIALRWILNNIPYCTHKEEISGLLDQINELREDL